MAAGGAGRPRRTRGRWAGIGASSIAESEEYPTLVALGVERRQLVVLGVARSLGVGLAAHAAGMAIATSGGRAALGKVAAEARTGITSMRSS